MNDTETIRTRRTPLIVAAVTVAIAVAAGLVWYLAFRDDAAARVDSDAAARARAQALADAGGEAVEVLDGVWTVDTTVGTFDQSCLTDVCSATFAGFRIDEELANFGAKTVVGRAPGVSGTMTLDGSVITAVEVTVDLTGLVTDSSSRNSAIRSQALETRAFPEARFTLATPIDLGSVPEPGAEVAVEATGELTIHGVTRLETIALTASFDGVRIGVVGALGPILLADYDIDKPRAAVVLSVEDNAIMELQLFFAKR